VTPPAWTSLVTGVDPGRHGIYSFTAPGPDYTERIVSAAQRQAPSVWHYLSAGQPGKAGCAVGVFNLSLSYPPEPVSGFLFSGFDTPIVSPRMVHPPEAFPVAMAGVVGYVHEGPDKMYEPEVVVRELGRQRRQQQEMLRNLTRAYPVEVLAVNFNSPDHVHHYAWPRGQTIAQVAAARGTAVEQVYRELDAGLGELLEEYTDEQTNVVLVSDHGGGPMRGQVSLAAALEAGGFLVRLTHPRSGGRRGLRGVAHRLLPRQVKGWLWSRAGERVRAEMAERLETGKVGKVDWARSTAFPWGSSGFVQVNLRGRQEQGKVAPEDKEKVLEEVEACLREVRDPVTGEAVGGERYRGEELYKWPRVGYLPDLLVEDNEYSFGSFWENREPVRNIEAEGEAYRGVTANHRPEGILATWGPAAQGEAQAGKPVLRMVDVAPALLYLAGVAIPEGLEGRLAREWWDTGEEPLRQAQGEAVLQEAPGEAYSEQEQAAVEERLRDLGYM
jgi:predicted AlkP superfamily phosphohydrolase/phosphomutase